MATNVFKAWLIYLIGNEIQQSHQEWYFLLSDETTGGLTVKPKTHLFHDEVCNRNRGAGHFIPISRDDEILKTMSAMYCDFFRLKRKILEEL